MAANLHEFDELYRLEHAQHFTRERTEREADVLVEVLKLQPHERVLDLGCGWGRHLGELKRRGFTKLVGIDVQEAFLEPLEGVTLLTGDATNLRFKAEFDAVYCAYNALFSDADAAPRVLCSVAEALKPKARFLLDTTNRERLAQADSPTRSWRESTPNRAGQFVVPLGTGLVTLNVPLLCGGELPWLLEETWFDLLTGAQRITQRRIFADGHVEARTLTRYHYTLSELISLLNAAGLTVTEVFGDWQLGPYTAVSPRTMLIARKEP